MSAESPRKTSRQSGHVVTPQPVSDRSIIESVAGFINEVVPQVIGFLLYLYSSLSFTHNLGLSHRPWPHYPIILCSFHTDTSCIKGWVWEWMWTPSKAVLIVYRVIRNEYSYFKGSYLQHVFLITGPKTQAHISVGHCARMMLAALWWHVMQ
jgi:hypothetical protein